MSTNLASSPLLKADLDAIARSLEPELREAFLRAATRMRQLLPIGEIAELFDTGDIASIIDKVGNLGLDAAARNALRDGLLQSATRAAEATAAEFNLAFDIVNPYAVRWAQQHAAETIQGISAETQQAVRDIINRAIIEGNAPRVQAQEIRRIVGLTQRDALAVDRFLQGLGQTPNARAQADRMADRLLRRRAENIARTETMLAANRGQQAAWDAAADQGLISRGAQKVWIATGDRRTCPICRVLDGKVVGFQDGFSISEEAIFDQAGEVAGTRPLKTPHTERTPPAHASCRCTTGLVFEEPEKRPRVRTTAQGAPQPTMAPPRPPSRQGPARQFSNFDESKQFINDHYGEWRQSFTSAEQSALNFYQSPGFELMNGQLRGLKINAPAPDLARARKATKDLQGAISRAPALKEDVTVWRGFNRGQFDLVQGAQISDPAFLSTSLTREGAGAVGRAAAGSEQVLAQIRLPAGTRAAAGSLKELVLAPGAQFRVVSVKGKSAVLELIG